MKSKSQQTDGCSSPSEPPATNTTPGGAQACSLTRQPQDSALSRQMEEFRQHQENWELQRQCDVERLRREGELLAEAWQRLESEERKLLSERELLRRSANKTRQAMPTTTSSTSSTQDQDQDHNAWLQFQQLRREIQTFGSRAT